MYIGSIEINVITENQWNTKLKLNNTHVELKIDTGAMVNILPLNAFNITKINSDKLEKTNTQLKSCTGDSLNVVGSCKMQYSRNNSIKTLCFYVVNSNTLANLGLKSLVDFGLVARVDKIVGIIYMQFCSW